MGVIAQIDNKKYYNILAIDGGGIRGLIPATAIEFMEKYACDYSVEKGYKKFPIYEGKDGVIAMKDMFDMMAGTSTGSIISAALSYPSGEVNADDVPIPKFFAKEVMDIYAKNGDRIFTKHNYSPSTGLQVLMVFIFCTIMGLIFHMIGK